MSTEDLSDEELVSRARRGDAHAFDAFVRRYTPRVYRWMARAVGVQDAEDMTQEVFLNAYRGLRRFRGDAPARAWLAAIADNAVKNRYRFLARFRRVFAEPREDEPAPDPREGSADPEARAAAGEARQNVAEALKLLPEEFRMAVVLRDLEEWSYEEIAASLRLPAGTVKSRIARGRDQLRRILAPLVRPRKE